MTNTLLERLSALDGVQFRGEGNDNGVKFILVPANASLPPQEVLTTTTASASNLVSTLEPFFRLQEGEKVDLKLIQEQADKARECTAGLCPHVSPLTLQRAAEEGTVQHVTLSSDDNNDVYMYWDESASLKRRPPNPRAMQYLHNAATETDETETIHGDVFLARFREEQIIPFGVDEMTKEFY